MNITPLAADSLGARSMATLVATPDVTILLDPSVRLGPYRYDLPPPHAGRVSSYFPPSCLDAANRRNNGLQSLLRKRIACRGSIAVSTWP